jgi:phospholipase C
MLKRSALILIAAAGVIVCAPFSRLAAIDSESDRAFTATPIRYVVVIFQENNSFDHYFATYPHAQNLPGEPPFYAAPATAAVNGLTRTLREHNPNSTAPFRLDRSEAVTCDNDNHYTDEQKAYNGGLVDKFPENTSASGPGCTPNLAMGYYDGNTVTGLWNYAQHFAMSDNFFDTEFGTTVMGHLNLISGQTHQTNISSIPGKIANGSVIANVEALYDDCATGTLVGMTGKNVGDLLNAKGVSWGWFYADFASTGTSNGKALCSTLYNNHYDPFQYYQTTANPHHLPPSSVGMIGLTDQANHQYALTDFWKAVANGNIPAVSFLKATKAQTGHAADSSPLAEQQFLVETINQLQQTPQWKHMAIIIAYDDSDGWYDHVMPPIVNQSNDPANDALLGPAGLCGVASAGAYQDRCGYGERLPFLVISPYAKRNFVDHSINDTTSILRFIEDNWQLGRIGHQSFDAIAGSFLNVFDFKERYNHQLILDPDTGEVVRQSGDEDLF